MPATRSKPLIENLLVFNIADLISTGPSLVLEFPRQDQFSGSRACPRSTVVGECHIPILHLGGVRLHQFQTVLGLTQGRGCQPEFRVHDKYQRGIISSSAFARVPRHDFR